MNEQHEKKPYNPYPLATGFASKNLPDKVTAAVFMRLGAHADFLGTTTLGLRGLMDETGYCHGRIVYAIDMLKALKRISKVPRYHPGQGRGRKSSITRVFCTKDELARAGANEENFFDKGGKSSGEPVLKAREKRRIPRKRSSESGKFETSKGQSTSGVKVNPEAGVKVNLETSKGQPLGQEPLDSNLHSLTCKKQEPLEPKKNQRQELGSSSLRGMKEKATPTPLPTVAIAPVGAVKTLTGSARPNASPEGHLELATVEKLVSFGCPLTVISEVTKLKHWSNALNKTTNVVTTYESLAMKPNNFATRMFQVWMPKRLLLNPLDDDDYVSYNQFNHESALKEGAKPQGERQLEAAKNWWNFMGMGEDEDDDYEERRRFIEFPKGRNSHSKVPDDQIVAAYQKYIEECREVEWKELVQKDRAAKAKKLETAAAQD